MGPVVRCLEAHGNLGFGLPSDQLETKAVNVASEGDSVSLIYVALVLQEPWEEKFRVFVAINLAEVESYVHPFSGVADFDLLDVILMFLSLILLFE